MTVPSPTPAAAPVLSDDIVATAAAGWPQWRSGRLASVTAPTGNLALVETRWLAEDGPDQDAAVAEAEAAVAPGVTVTTLQRTDLSTGRPERGLRIWDAASPGIVHFDTVTGWEFDPAWVVSARFTPIDAANTVSFEHIRDNGGTRDLVVPGDITFTLHGTDHRLSAFDDGGTLLLVFGDTTNSADDDTASYEAGRFLFVERPPHAFGEAGDVVLDFNRAFVPPCGFSVHYNCPLPPRNNRFGFPVTAGEKLVRFRDGHTLY
ncbi:DUF1684 domain-containing protein [Cryobacterium sp. SO2]|uniref:DUF1684 domain-containing protein n=1 Tax=Cryobacterium sp. SO2 TaxID=1897060 RepID=UPI00223D9D05|nr:DUF1684 domain-containing protein [Cryobacterium sp. SO2]WEO78191.1 DUF1684 domain-containing protein [Cryobacterium sp. SO2]